MFVFLLQLLAYYFLFLAACQAVIQFVTLIFMLSFFGKEPPKYLLRYDEGVSILKPLCGVDENLEENLEALSRLDYPKFEVIFCLENPEDKARILAQEFIDNHPEIDAKIAIGSDESIANGKVRNMMNGYKVMKYDLFWISDARILIAPNALKDLVCRMTDDTGMVHSMPTTVRKRPKTIGGAMEKLMFGCVFARVFCSAYLLGIPCSIGMSMMLRKSYLNKHCDQGLKDFANYMAEDNYLARHVLRKGLRLRLSSCQAFQNSGKLTIEQHVTRMKRLSFFGKEPPKYLLQYDEGVSILKPLCGVDENLEENLGALSRLDYPKFEVIFCLENPEDKARILAQEFIDNHPEIDAKIAIGSDESIANGKVRNMMNGYKVIKYDLFWISDARILIAPNALKDLVCRMTDDTGMVHSVPTTVRKRPRTIGGAMEKLTFGCVFARILCSGYLIGIPTSVGMSMMLRKSFIDKHCVNGLKDFSNYMAEDSYLARLVLRNGLRLRLSSYQAFQNSGKVTIAQHMGRMQRWAKLRLYTSPLASTLLEPTSYGLSSGILLSWSLYLLYSYDPMGTLLLHTITWLLFDWLFLLLTEGDMWMTWYQLLVAWSLNHALSFCYFLMAIGRPKFVWKSRKYRLHYGGIYTVDK